MFGGPDPRYTSHELIDAALAFMHEHLIKGKKVLVHCKQGQYRGLSHPENNSEGTDTVFSNAAAYTLSANVENLTLSDGIALYGTGNSLANALIGNSNDNVLDSGSGNDDLTGGTGDDSLVGGAGNDIYRFAEGDGQDVINDSGNTDQVVFGSSVAQSMVAVFQTAGGDLQIGYTDSAGDLVTVQNYATSGHEVEDFVLSTGNHMTNADINSVITAMASYATTNSVSFTSLGDVESNSNLMTIVNGGWHP
jgi:Ca2+-binding RTX toxin-like protein